MEDTTSMKSWRLEVIGNCVQAEEYDSFIGGKAFPHGEYTTGHEKRGVE